MNVTELVEAVLARCGKLPENTEELEQADIIRASNWVLRRIAEKITITVLRSVTTVAGTREYVVASTTLRVRKVYPSNGIDEHLLELGSHSEATGSTEDYYNFPSTWQIKMMKKFRALPKFQWRYDPINRKLVIDPHPLETGKKYWYLSVEKSKWTLAALPEDFEELVITGTTWFALEQVALKRSDLGGVIRDGGFVTYPATELKRFVDSLKDEFYSELRVKQKLYSR